VYGHTSAAGGLQSSLDAGVALLKDDVLEVLPSIRAVDGVRCLFSLKLEPVSGFEVEGAGIAGRMCTAAGEFSVVDGK
jgi:hypothetical protein